jgi:hypothetical protein
VPSNLHFRKNTAPSSATEKLPKDGKVTFEEFVSYLDAPAVRLV